MSKKKKRIVQSTSAYSVVDELLASDTQPMDSDTQQYQHETLHACMNNIEGTEQVNVTAWLKLSDVVNLMETLVMYGEAPVSNDSGFVFASHWRGCDGLPVEVADSAGLLTDAMSAMAGAAKRHAAGEPISLDAHGTVAVQTVLDNYLAVLQVLPARTMVRCHRRTEKRLRELMKQDPQRLRVITL